MTKSTTAKTLTPRAMNRMIMPPSQGWDQLEVDLLVGDGEGVVIGNREMLAGEASGECEVDEKWWYSVDASSASMRGGMLGGMNGMASFGEDISRWFKKIFLMSVASMLSWVETMVGGLSYFWEVRNLTAGMALSSSNQSLAGMI
jgi:hypothetical protein